jgi:hypothetical protein
MWKVHGAFPNVRAVARSAKRVGRRRDLRIRLNDVAGLPSVGPMLLLPERRRRGLRDALRTARATYRKHSRAPAPPPAVVRDAEPDVVLDIPKLRIDAIDLELDELQARVALDARELDLLGLHVGADAALGRVKLAIHGVEAQATLRVRLDNVAGILGRVMDTVDHTPSLAEAVRSAATHRRSRKPLADGSA